MFFTNSSSIIQSRIDEFKNYYKKDMDVSVLNSIQKCAQIIPDVGVSGGGSAAFGIQSNNYNSYITLDSFPVEYHYKNLSEQAKCNLKASKPYNRIKMKCIEEFIEESNIRLRLHYQKFYDEILKNIKQIDNEFKNICIQIKPENKTIKDWSLIESSDMYQSEYYCGGFEADEKSIVLVSLKIRWSIGFKFQYKM